MFTKIVKFKDGTYGIRRWNWGHYEFLDARGTNDWWGTPEFVVKYCHANDINLCITLLEHYRLSEAIGYLESMSPDIGTPVRFN